MGVIRKILFGSKAAGSDYISRAEEVALTLPRRVTGGQARKAFSTNNQVKKNELTALGLDALLDQEMITKQELLEHIRDNQVELEVETDGGPGTGVKRTDFDFTFEPLSFEEAQGDFIQERISEIVDGELEYYVNSVDYDGEKAEEVQALLDGKKEFTDLDGSLQEEIENDIYGALNDTYNQDPVYELVLEIDGSPTDYRLLYQEEFGDEYFPRGDAPPFVRRAFQGDTVSYARGAEPLPNNLNEAKVRLQSLAMDLGDLEFPDEDDLRWGEYTTRGGENYTEERVRIRKMPQFGRFEEGQVKFKEGIHFPDDINNIFHIRTTDRTDDGGRKILYIEELQSDWGQKARSQFDEKGNYKGGGILDPRVKINSAVKARKFIDEIEPIFEKVLNAEENKSYLNLNVFGTKLENLLKRIKDIKRVDGPSDEMLLELVGDIRGGVLASFERESVAPEAKMPQDFKNLFFKSKEAVEKIEQPVFKQRQEKFRNKLVEFNPLIGKFSGEKDQYIADTDAWTRLAIKHIFKKANDEGYDGIAFTPGQFQFERWGKKGLLKFYDESIPRTIEKTIGKRKTDANLYLRENNDVASAPIYYLDDVQNKGGKTAREQGEAGFTAYSLPIAGTAVGLTGLAALTPEEARAAEMMSQKAQTMMRDGSGVESLLDKLQGAGEVVGEGVSSLLLQPFAGALASRGAFDVGADADAVARAAEEARGLVDFDAFSPTGQRYKQSALESLAKLGGYLTDEGEPMVGRTRSGQPISYRKRDPIQTVFQDALEPASEATVEGIMSLVQPFDEEDERVRALRRGIRPLAEIVSPI